MSDYPPSETMRMAMIARGYTEPEVSALLGTIKAEAWDDGWNAGAVDAMCHCTDSLNRTTNPYRETQ